MQYQKPSFTLPAAPARISQTDWEIAVGLRNPDGTLVTPKPRRKNRIAILGEGYFDDVVVRRVPKECSIG